MPSGRASDVVREALSSPETYPHGPAAVEVRETHISWVLLAGELDYKLKKPLVLDLSTNGTGERRRTMCEEEVRLNRRTAPGIYLGVRGVAISGGGVELTAADDPRTLEFVVEMRRYDERDTLTARLDWGELDRAQVREVAGVLARFGSRSTKCPRARTWRCVPTARSSRSWRTSWRCWTVDGSASPEPLSTFPQPRCGPARLARPSARCVA